MNGSVAVLNSIIGESNKSVIKLLSETSSIIRAGCFAFTDCLAYELVAGLIITAKSKLDINFSAVAMTFMKA